MAEGMVEEQHQGIVQNVSNGLWELGLLGAWAVDRLTGCVFHRVGPPGTAYPVEFEQLSTTDEDAQMTYEQLEEHRASLIKAIERVVLARAYQEAVPIETAVPNPSGEGVCRCSIRVASHSDADDNRLMRQVAALINETFERSHNDLLPRADDEYDPSADMSEAIESEATAHQILSSTDGANRQMKELAGMQRRRGDTTRRVTVSEVRERILASTVAQGRALLLATVTLPSGEPLLVACVCVTTNFKGSIGTGHAGMLAVAAGWEQTGLGARMLQAAEAFSGFHDGPKMQLEFYNVCEPGWGSRPFYICELMREWYTTKMQYLEQEVIFVSRQWGEVKCRENLNYVIATRDISEYIVTNPDMQDVLDHLESKLKVCDEDLQSRAAEDSKVVGVVPHSTVGEVELDKFEKVEQ